jgi:hypothetical protein
MSNYYKKEPSKELVEQFMASLDLKPYIEDDYESVSINTVLVHGYCKFYPKDKQGKWSAEAVRNEDGGTADINGTHRFDANSLEDVVRDFVTYMFTVKVSIPAQGRPYSLGTAINKPTVQQLAYLSKTL